MDRQGVIYAAIYGAAAAGIAYLLSFGSLLAFIGIMIAFAITIRVWAWRYRVRHGLPLRRGLRPSDRKHGSDEDPK